jgi:uncharacterized protein
MDSATTQAHCRNLVIKVASRCNLNCTYCYMYNMGDETYRNQPKVMSDRVAEALITRVYNHCKRHGLTEFAFTFHGGEPMLAGKKFFRRFTAKVNAALLPEINPIFVMQTNGVLLDEEWCRLLGELNINFGISLDGKKEDNDRYRIDHAGRGSYDSIVRGLNTALQSSHIKKKPGLLSVININSDPVETYEHFKSLGIDAVDFLLPEATHQKRPQRPLDPAKRQSETPYADWLIGVFDVWFHEPHPKRRIRTFNHLIHSLLGGTFTSDILGDCVNAVLVIETDGGIEAVDALKVCGHGFTKAGTNVLHNELDDAMQTDLASLYIYSHSRLSEVCLACPLKDICGGGYLPHRYSEHNGFNNPSVYCRDLVKLIAHMQHAILDQMPDTFLKQSGLKPVNANTILATIDKATKIAATTTNASFSSVN